MKTILLDENVPRPLKRFLIRSSHGARTVQNMGWKSTTNGKLLDAAESMFDIFLTADKGIRYQQNMNGQKIAILIVRPKRVRMKDLEPMF